MFSNHMNKLAFQWSRQHTPMNRSVMPAKLICSHHELDSPVKKAKWRKCSETILTARLFEILFGSQDLTSDEKGKKG